MPKRPCIEPGCSQLVKSGRCDYHARKRNDAKNQQQALRDKQRPTASQRGYDARWRKARAVYLKENPFCVDCIKDGLVKRASVVDHITDHKGDYDLFWDQGNWQSLCYKHHSQKTVRDNPSFVATRSKGGWG